MTLNRRKEKGFVEASAHQIRGNLGSLNEDLRVPAAHFYPKPPSFSPRISELQPSQCWGLTGRCSYVQVNFTWKKDAGASPCSLSVGADTEQK